MPRGKFHNVGVTSGRHHAKRITDTVIVAHCILAVSSFVLVLDVCLGFTTTRTTNEDETTTRISDRTLICTGLQPGGSGTNQAEPFQRLGWHPPRHRVRKRLKPFSSQSRRFPPG